MELSEVVQILIQSFIEFTCILSPSDGQFAISPSNNRTCMVANRLSMPEEVKKSFIFDLSGFSEELFQSQKIAHLINSWMCLYILKLTFKIISKFLGIKKKIQTG